MEIGTKSYFCSLIFCSAYSTRNCYPELRAPPEVWKLIKTFWDKNKDSPKDENWGVGMFICEVTCGEKELS